MSSGKYSDDWELLKKIATANNQGDTQTLYSLIADNDFSDKPFASDAAVTSIELTVDNVAQNKDVLIQFARSASANIDAMDIRAKFRMNVLHQLLEEHKPS